MTDKKHVIAQVFGLMISVIAVINLAGYVSGVPELYKWGAATGMALPTVIALLMTGIALFMIGTDS